MTQRITGNKIGQDKKHIDPREIKEHTMRGGQVDRLSKNVKPKSNRSVSVNVGESPLSWLYAHKHLSERQFLAGEKLRIAYERAVIGTNITMSWNPMPPSKGRRAALGQMDQSESRLNAKQRFDDAIACLGDGLEDVAWRVICNCESVSSAEKALGWPTRSGKLVLKLALDRLANHYRIA